MGIPYSKPEASELVETVEKNVVNLIIRLNEQEDYINSSLKCHILKALEFYSKKIDELRKTGYFSCNKMFRMKELIIKASTDLKYLKSQKREIDNMGPEPDIKELKKDILDFQKESIDNGAEKIDRTKFFKTCHFYSQKLEENPEEEDVQISIVILEVFLKFPLKKFSEIFQKDLEALDNVTKNFQELDFKNISVYNRHKISEKLSEMKTKLEHLLCLINEDFLNDISVPPIMTKIHEDLDDYKKLTKCLVPPTSDVVIDTIQTKICYLNDELTSLTEENEEITEQKKNLSNKAKGILTTLKCIENKNEEIKKDEAKLIDLNAKVLNVVHSDDDFFTKKLKLQTLLQEVISLGTRNNKEIVPRTCEIKKKIYVFLRLLCANYLSDIKEAIPEFKEYAESFSFTKHSKIYEMRRQEISLLAECLDELGEDDFEPLCDGVKNEIDEVLDVLEKRAEDNQQLLHLINQLKLLIDNLIDISILPDTPTAKLQELNKVRTTVNNIQNCDFRILRKKPDVYSQLHQIEEQIFCKLPEEVREFKRRLIEEERKVLEFTESLGSDAYEKGKNQILKLLQDVEQSDPDNEAILVLLETGRQLLTLLESLANQNKNKNDCLQCVQIIKEKISSLSPPESLIQEALQLLDMYQELLYSIEYGSKELDVLEKTVEAKKLLILERAKLELKLFDTSKMKNLSEQLKFGTNHQKFKQHFKELLAVREKLKSLPVEESEPKNSYLEEIHTILKTLEESVARLVTPNDKAKKKYEIKNHWSDFKMTLNEKSGQTSLEKLNLLVREAEEVEKCIQQCVEWEETKKSIDYKQISQHLSFLLEELKTLTKNEILEKCISQGIDYVQTLIINFCKYKV